MMDLAFTNDPYDTDLDELKRRYMLAQELANPKGVSPIAGALFKIFQKPKTDAIEAEFRDLNARRQSERQDSLRKIAEVMAGPKREAPYVPASMPQVDDEGYQQPGTMADTMQKNAAAQEAFGDKRTRIAQELLMSKFPDIQQHGMKLMEKQGPAKLTYQNLGDRTIGVDEMGNIANTYQHGVSPNTVYDKTRVSAGTQFTHTTPSADAMMRHGSMSADQKADLQAKIADMVDRGVAVPPDLFRAAYGGAQAAPMPAPMPQPAQMPQGGPPTGIPPEVLAAAQSGKPFHMTQAPGQAPVNQPLPPQMPSPAAMRAAAAQGREFDQNGVMRLRQGSPEFAKQSNAHAKDYQTVLGVNTKINHALDQLDYILDPKNEGAFNSHFGGYNAYATQFLPGETQNMGQKIETLKENLKSAGLELARTGGAIGQITEKEWKILEGMVSRLKTTMSEDQAKAEFDNIKRYLATIGANAEDVYKTEWGGSQFEKKLPEKRKTNEASGEIKFSNDKEKRYQEWKARQGQ